MQLHTVGLQRDPLWQELHGGGLLSADASAMLCVDASIKPHHLLQVSHHMATTDAQAEAKGDALEDNSKSNTIPEVRLKCSLLLLLTWHHVAPQGSLLMDEVKGFPAFFRLLVQPKVSGKLHFTLQTLCQWCWGRLYKLATVPCQPQTAWLCEARTTQLRRILRM